MKPSEETDLVRQENRWHDKHDSILYMLHEFYLKKADPTFKAGAVALNNVTTGFEDLPRGANQNRGHLLVINFWAYGDDEEETMRNLDRLFRNLFEASRGVSSEIGEGIRQSEQAQQQTT